MVPDLIIVKKTTFRARHWLTLETVSRRNKKMTSRESVILLKTSNYTKIYVFNWSKL
jgi:hypothetical protein